MRPFAYVAIAPFLFTGLAMLVLWPWRRRPAVLWPALVARFLLRRAHT